MDFSLTDDQRMLADSLDRYLAQRYPIDRRHAAAATPQGYDVDLWAGLVELGPSRRCCPSPPGDWAGAALTSPPCSK
ncbi:MAG: acyl-CoA dehydrogenase family protein, partial [Tepidimonas fonticaldi]|nr:acyl-CoA dehydrogenase family protein [Tepidimonas fonticaldi]